MHATELLRPFHRVGWVQEEKYDGWRMIAYKDGTDVQLISRAGKDHSHRFAGLAAAIRTLPPGRLILDGEVAIFDDQLVSRFEWFRKRPEDAVSTPPVYMAFDCLYLEGRDLRRLPLRERRTELERVVENDQRLIFPARRLAPNGLEAWREVLERGYEGLVGKDESAPYRGGRTLLWLKVRPAQLSGRRTGVGPEAVGRTDRVALASHRGPRYVAVPMTGTNRTHSPSSGTGINSCACPHQFTKRATRKSGQPI